MKGSERHRLKENELSHVLSDATRASAGESPHVRPRSRHRRAVARCAASDTGHGRRAAKTARRPCWAMPSSSCRRRWRSRSPEPSPAARAIQPCRRARKPRLSSLPRSTTRTRRPTPASRRGITPPRRWRCSAATPRQPRAFRKPSIGRATNSFYGRMARLGVVETNAAGEEIRRGDYRGAGAREQHERRHDSDATRC